MDCATERMNGYGHPCATALTRPAATQHVRLIGLPSLLLIVVQLACASAIPLLTLATPLSTAEYKLLFSFALIVFYLYGN